MISTLVKKKGNLTKKLDFLNYSNAISDQLPC